MSKQKQLPRLVMEGEITCIHHDHTGEIGRGLNQKLKSKGKGKGFEVVQDPYEYSALDIKVGDAEMSVIRPDAAQFYWENPERSRILSGSKVRVTIEILEAAPER